MCGGGGGGGGQTNLLSYDMFEQTIANFQESVRLVPDDEQVTCSVLQGVAVCCMALQGVAMCCSVL